MASHLLSWYSFSKFWALILFFCWKFGPFTAWHLSSLASLHKVCLLYTSGRMASGVVVSLPTWPSNVVTAEIINTYLILHFNLLQLSKQLHKLVRSGCWWHIAFKQFKFLFKCFFNFVPFLMFSVLIFYSISSVLIFALFSFLCITNHVYAFLCMWMFSVIYRTLNNYQYLKFKSFATQMSN